MEFPLVKFNIKMIICILGDKMDMTEEELRILKGKKQVENVNFGDKLFPKILEDPSNPTHEKTMFN